MTGGCVFPHSATLCFATPQGAQGGEDGGPGAWPGQGAKGEEGTRNETHSFCSRLLVFVLPLRKSWAEGASDEKSEAPLAQLFLRGRKKQANGCRMSAFHL